MTTGERIYLAFGLVIKSDFELPLLETTQPDNRYDLAIINGAIADSIKERSIGFEFVDLQDGFLFSVPKIATYFITPAQADKNGEKRISTVVVDLEPGASLIDMQLFLLGSAFSVILHHKQDVILHGSAIKIGDQAVVLAGRAGIGKSTLTAAFMKMGYQILADDVSVIRLHGNLPPQVLPAYPQIKLWDKSLEMLNIGTKGLASAYGRSKKFIYSIEQYFYSRPLNLEAIYILDLGLASKITLKKLTGKTAFSELHNNTYRIGKLSKFGNIKKHFLACTMLLGQTTIFSLTRPKIDCDLDPLINAIIKNVSLKATGNL